MNGVIRFFPPFLFYKKKFVATCRISCEHRGFPSNKVQKVCKVFQPWRGVQSEYWNCIAIGPWTFVRRIGSPSSTDASCVHCHWQRLDTIGWPRVLCLIPQGQVMAHMVWGRATSKVLFSRVPIEDILKAARWKSPTMLVTCYLMDRLDLRGCSARINFKGTKSKAKQMHQESNG